VRIPSVPGTVAAKDAAGLPKGRVAGASGDHHRSGSSCFSPLFDLPRKSAHQHAQTFVPTAPCMAEFQTRSLSVRARSAAFASGKWPITR
jgi:hypothetical protein